MRARGCIPGPVCHYGEIGTEEAAPCTTGPHVISVSGRAVMNSKMGGGWKNEPAQH